MQANLAFTVAFCLFLSTVHAQLNCLQGYEAQNVPNITLMSQACSNDGPSYSCKRFDVTATVAGQTGKSFIFCAQQLDELLLYSDGQAQTRSILANKKYNAYNE